MAPARVAPAVAARDLVLAYESVVALRGSSFEIPAGRVTALIGPNGSGKSTLLGAVAGLVKPAGGDLAVFGAPPVSARRRIAYVLQATEVDSRLPITVREVVTMGTFATTGWFGRVRAAERARVDAALDTLGIAHLSSRSIRDLSGGQRQRVFIAQGLVQSADLLLLDEPVTGLDTPSHDVILKVVGDLRSGGRTVVMTTHDLDEASVADHVLVLSGRVVASGAPAEVLTSAVLEEAYGTRMVHAVDGAVVFDDPHHHHGH